LELDSSAQRALSRCKVECEEKWEAFISEENIVHPVPSSPPRDNTNKREAKASRTQQASAVSGPRRVVRKQAAQQKEQHTSKVQSGPSRVQAKAQPSNNNPPAPSSSDSQADPFNLDSTLNNSNNKHWAEREECFKSIAANIDNVAYTLTPHATTRFAAALSSHIVDPHHRVAQAALEATLVCLEKQNLAQLLSMHLPLLLPPILAQLVSAKATQREISNEVLNACRRAYDPNALAAVLCSKFGEASDRVKPGILELLSVIVPEASEYLGVVTNMRSFLQRLGLVSAVRPPPHQHLVSAIEQVRPSEERRLERSDSKSIIPPTYTTNHLALVHRPNPFCDSLRSSQAISAMFHLNDAVFVAACSALPSGPQMAVKKILTSTRICMNIEERIASHLRGDKYVPPSLAPVPVRGLTHAVRSQSPIDGSTAPYEIESPAVNSPDPNPSSSFGRRHGSSSSGNVAWAETNAATTRTPSPAPMASNAPGTDPVIKYMVRPPLSEEKVSRDWMRDTPEILSMLSMSASAQDQYSGMQQMVQLARQNQPEVWSKYFGQILLSLLEGIGQTSLHPNQMSPTNAGAGKFSNDNASAIKHLYLQGVRALLKYQPVYFADYIEIVIDRLLQCSKDPSYEIVHTSERALENLVTALDASRCLKVIMPYLERSSEPEMLLSCVRTLQKFINRIPSSMLLADLQFIIPPLIHCFNSPNVDMRKR